MEVLVGTVLREYSLWLMANRHNDCLSRRCVLAAPEKHLAFALKGAAWTQHLLRTFNCAKKVAVRIIRTSRHQSTAVSSCMRWRSRVRLAGLVKYSFMPHSMPSCSSDAKAYAERPMMGTSGDILRISRVAS